jgi:hypothetical protein
MFLPVSSVSEGGPLPGQEVVFGFGAHSSLDEVPELLRMAQQADRDGLDIFSLSDHPYIGGRLDAYAAVVSCSAWARAGCGTASRTWACRGCRRATPLTPSKRPSSWSRHCAAAARR